MSSKLMHRGVHEAVDELEKTKLMQRGPYDARDELENSLLQSFASLQSQLTPPYQLPSQSSVELARLNQALLYGILVQPQTSQSLITHLAAVTSDGYASFVSLLLRLVNESYPKLLDHSRAQLLWLVRQLINLSAADVDSLCLSLLRRIVGGDISQGNIWLSTQLLDILRSNWSWLTGNPVLLTIALFTYLRILPDHCMAKNPALNELKQGEIAFCIQILRDRFQDCLVIGRDLVRLLQDVAFIPEFEAIWRDLLSNPAAFAAAGFEDIAQLYVVRTPTRYLASRITPEMESQIRFMLTHVRWGSQRRYQTWFAHRFLSTPGSETLVCDLIRFICCVHHPTNQILQSDIVPRWAIVGWLLKICKSSHVEANAKLALFYDWFFFMSKTDNIMNIEPALLLMVHSIPKYMDMTHSLLEFLFLSMEHYDPSRKDLILRGVTSSMDILIGKCVVLSLEPLSGSSFVAPWLREKLVMYFPLYCKSDPSDVFKAGKHEPLQQETSVVGPVPQLGAKNTSPGTLIKLESSSVADATFVGNHTQLVDAALVNNPDTKLNDTSDTMPHKKRRIDSVMIGDLVEVLTRSQEEAINVLEKLLVSFLSGSNSSTVDRRQDSVLLEAGQGKPVDDCAAKSQLFAQQISDVLKESGYALFAPLCGHPTDSPEGDEIVSLTSAIFRMYIQSRHPQLLQILLSWYGGGLAVGARFLCYVCRLAEGVSQSYTSVLKNCSVDSMGPDSGATITTLVKQDNECMPVPLRCKEENCSSNGQPPPQKRIEAVATSAFLWHMSMQNNGLHGGIQKVNPESSSEDMSNSNRSLQSTVRHAFNAYEEYLKNVPKLQLSSTMGGVSSAAAVASDNCKLANGILKVEAREASEDDSELSLLGDLEVCLTWNVHRLLLVFPSVFVHLPQLSEGKVEVIRLLVSVLDPLELSKFEFKLSLKEISALGLQQSQIVELIKSSLQWDCFEQQYFWRLFTAELQHVASPFAEDLIKNCAILLEPSKHFEAMSGLLLFLRMQCPSTQLLSYMFLLPQEFGRLVGAVFASWVSMDAMKFFGYVNMLLLQNFKSDREMSDGIEQHGFLVEKMNTSALSAFIKFLENYLKQSNDMDEKTKMEALQTKHLFQELAKMARLEWTQP